MTSKVVSTFKMLSLCHVPSRWQDKWTVTPLPPIPGVSWFQPSASQKPTWITQMENPAQVQPLGHGQPPASFLLNFSSKHVQIQQWECKKWGSWTKWQDPNNWQVSTGFRSLGKWEKPVCEAPLGKWSASKNSCSEPQDAQLIRRKELK